MYLRQTALPSPSLHPTIFQRLRFKLARANAIVYNACIWHRRRLEFITRIKGKRALSGPPPLKKLSVGQNLVMLMGISGRIQIDRQPSHEIVEQSRSYSQPPPPVAQVEERRWEYSQAWVNGTTMYQPQCRGVKRRRDYEQQCHLPDALQHPSHRLHTPISTHLPSLDSRCLPRHALDPWDLPRHAMSVGKQILDQGHMYRSSAPSPSPRSEDVQSSSPSPHHVAPTSEHARPFRPSEAGNSAPVVRTYVKEHCNVSTHTAALQTYCHKHPRTRGASRLFARQLPYRSSADSRVSYRAHRHRRSRTSSPGHSFAQSSRHALSSPVRRTPHNVRARSIPSQSRDISVPWYATPPVSSVGRERWSGVTAGETAEVMQTSRRADARKRPLHERRVHSGDGIDVPARKKFRATA